MKAVHNVVFYPGSKEEDLPDFHPAFPYIASRAEFGRFRDFFVPWHWHKAVELFYMESGALEYCTPGGTVILPEGSGGMVNSNILHMTRLPKDACGSVQLLHLFDPGFISGGNGSLIDQKYVMPVVSNTGFEILSLFPGRPEQEEILALIRKSFELKETERGYELRLRGMLSEIWLGLAELVRDQAEVGGVYRKTNDSVKLMMIYIQEHYAEKITAAEVADAAFLSERECYRIFRTCLHMTPGEYIRNYRLQTACRMLSEGKWKLTEISRACGLGNSSYFGKTFRESMGCTPLEYRQRWQDNDMK